MLFTIGACTDTTTTLPMAPEALSAIVSSSLVRDQYNAADPAPQVTIGIGGSGDQRLAQTFTAGLSGRLAAVALPIGCDARARVRIDIREIDRAGGPGWPAIATTVVPGSTFPPTVGIGTPFTRVTIPGNRTIVAHARYTIAVGAVGNCAVVPAPNGDTYVPGDFYFRYSGLNAWLPNRQYGISHPWDLPFETLVEIP
ncbi:MAG: hypothetical protein U0132_04315 [Gemmatimonadaceae bacterium]